MKKTDGTPKPSKESKLFTILRDDIGEVDFQRTLRREFAELKEVMLTEERQERLKGMNRLKRGLFFQWWLLKSMIRKLTPARRLMFVLGLILLFFHFEAGGENYHFTNIGAVLVVFVLLLELKDKLIAHAELNAGRIVQQSLMPERTPAVAGWELWLFTRSANEVGGDLIDFIRIDERRFGIALGDVAGKGLSAALLSAKLQATIKAIAPDYTSFDALGAKLNQIYCRDGIRTLFASLNYLECRSDSGIVRILNAGHMPPIVVKDGKTETLKKGGPALGIVPNGEYSEQSVELRKDHILLLYSDGVTEAQNVSGDFYGEERLISLLPRIAAYPAEFLGTTLVAEVDRFVGDAKVMDDLSIVILKRTA